MVSRIHINNCSPSITFSPAEILLPTLLSIVYTDPIDYVPNTVELTFTPTISQVTVTVIINNDDIVEDPEQFTAVLNADAGLPVVTAPEVAFVTITEDVDTDRNDTNTTDSKGLTIIITTVVVLWCMMHGGWWCMMHSGV